MASVTLHFRCTDKAQVKDLVRYMETFFSKIDEISYREKNSHIHVAFTGYGTQLQIDNAIAHISRIQRS